MGSTNRILSHQLSNGLYVSGAPEQHKERTPTMKSTVMPYTGGDIKKSGELGKMFDINVVEAPKVRKSGPINSNNAANISSTSSGRIGSFRASSVSHSGPLNPPPPPQITHLGTFGRHNSHSGPIPKMGSSGSATLKAPGPPSRQNSGPLTPLPTTGLIVSSGPIPLVNATKNHSGPVETNSVSKTHSLQSNKALNNQAINHLPATQSCSIIRDLPRVILWTIVPLFIIGFIAGAFILAAVQDAILLIVVVCLFSFVVVVVIWNAYMGSKVVMEFVARYPDFGLNEAKDGQYVKITGIVTCASVPLKSSFQKVSRCVYTSCGLYEYRNLNSNTTIPNHKMFTWGLRYMERKVVDFYISDYKSGLRALVKVGYGANVSPYVDENTIVDVAKNREISPDLSRWLLDHNLPNSDNAMRLSEGFIKEGSTVTIMGVIQKKTDNVLMIVPPSDLISTGCQWGKLFFPTNLFGIILICQDSLKDDVVPV